MLDLADVKRFAGKGAKPEILAGIVGHSDWLERFNIAGGKRLPHFMAQLGHECDGFRTLEEYASGAAYEGRADLGNVHAGDGKRFKGRALIQCTGRANYRAFTAWVRKLIAGAPDFEAEPQRICEFPYALLSAVWYWTTRKLNALADRDDIVGITKKINGGKNGLADRRKRLAKALTIWGEPHADPATFAGVAPFKPSRSLIEVIQRRLDAMGYAVGGIDGGDHGLSMTTGAIASFRHDRGLPGDGEINEDLLADLDRAEAEGWQRKVADVRQAATARDLADKNAAVRESWLQRLIAKVGAFGTACVAAVKGAGDYVPDVNEYLDPLKEFVTGVHPLVWCALAFGVAVYLWRSANKVEADQVEAHRKGRLL